MSSSIFKSKFLWIIVVPLLILGMIMISLISFAFFSERKSSTSHFLSRHEAINLHIEELALKTEYIVHSSYPFTERIGTEKRIVVSKASLTSEGLLSICERLHQDMVPESHTIIEIFLSKASAERWVDPKIAKYSNNLVMDHIYEALIDWHHVGTYIKSDSLSLENCDTVQRGLLHDVVTVIDYKRL